MSGFYEWISVDCEINTHAQHDHLIQQGIKFLFFNFNSHFDISMTVNIHYKNSTHFQIK